MGISDKIEAFILELLKQEEEDWLKIQRNELAQIFGCVPSQINYVISTRFNDRNGYIVQSKRGGGGCIMLRRADNLRELPESISLTQCNSIIKEMCLRKDLTEREEKIVMSALKCADVDTKRAEMLNGILNEIT